MATLSFADLVGYATYLDNFDGADANPLPGWSATGLTGGTVFQRTSNQAQRQGAGNGSTYRMGVFVGADQIAYVNIAVLWTCTLYIRVKDPGAGTVDGYAAYYDDTAHTIELGKFVNGTYSTVSQTSFTATAADDMGIAAVGSDFVVATRTSGTWTDRVQTTDTSYAGAAGDGVAIEGDGTTGRFDNLFAGTIVQQGSASTAWVAA